MPSDINNNGKNSNTSLSDTHTLTNKESDGALSTSIVTKPDSPHPCPPPPPPSPVEYVAECSLSETKPKDATVLSSSTGAAGPATAKSKVDLSGMSRQIQKTTKEEPSGIMVDSGPCSIMAALSLFFCVFIFNECGTEISQIMFSPIFVNDGLCSNGGYDGAIAVGICSSFTIYPLSS
ncbi:hypothetical protein BZA77DRAFT_291982 [Pyronema omphalodes]|nr:hypothetical protein BZA77DRAFT_291982 [Pyronema omphalodes]